MRFDLRVTEPVECVVASQDTMDALEADRHRSSFLSLSVSDKIADLAASRDLVAVRDDTMALGLILVCPTAMAMDASELEVANQTQMLAEEMAALDVHSCHMQDGVSWAEVAAALIEDGWRKIK